MYQIRMFENGNRDAAKDLFFRFAELDRSLVDEKKRSVELSFSSENGVRRWYGTEYLLHGHGNVNLKHIKSMGAGLLNHNPAVIVGPLRNIRIEEKRGKATLIFDQDDDGEKAMRKVMSGSLKGVSVGYMLDRAREVKKDEEFEGIKGPALVALRWTPYEISLTPIPADATVGIGRDLTRSLDGIDIKTSKQEVKDMDEKEVLALIRGEVEKLNIPKADDVAAAVRNMLAEDARPQIRVNTETLTDLLGRAGAVSTECKAMVADMAVQGKTDQEITNFILDQATGKPDSTDAGGGAGSDGTGRDETQTAAIAGGVSSFKQVEDDQFFRSLVSPTLFPIQ